VFGACSVEGVCRAAAGGEAGVGVGADSYPTGPYPYRASKSGYVDAP